MGKSDSKFDIFSVKWQIEDLLQYAVEWKKIINTWKETSIGLALDQVDKTGALNGFTHLEENLEPIGSAGYFHYWHDGKSQWEGIAEGFRASPSLNDYQWPIAQLKGLHSWVIDNSIDFAKQSKVSIAEFDIKMKQLKFESELATKDKFIASWLDYYDQFFKPWLDTFSKRAPELFKQGIYYGFADPKGNNLPFF